mmetsp:Transcript_75683/g.246062  ORF Transcript_75683/g.246062 Transcript_75683/m.246062 type:complete len:683 (+) Transcript_75683:61-2109(+)
MASSHVPAVPTGSLQRSLEPLRCVPRADGLLGCCCQGRLAFGVPAGRVQTGAELRCLAGPRRGIELLLLDPLPLLTRASAAVGRRRPRAASVVELSADGSDLDGHTTSSSSSSSSSRSSGGSSGDSIHGRELNDPRVEAGFDGYGVELPSLPYTTFLEPILAAFDPGLLRLRAAEGLPDEAWATWITELRSAPLITGSDQSSEEDGKDEAWSRALRAWHCAADRDLLERWDRWLTGGGMWSRAASAAPASLPWSAACAAAGLPLKPPRGGGPASPSEAPASAAHVSVTAAAAAAAASTPHSAFALCISGQPRGAGLGQLARIVCASALPQFLEGESIDAFLFVFLSGQRCGGCWEGSCQDRGLGACVRHRDGRPEDALPDALREAEWNQWKAHLQAAVRMCPGSRVGSMGVAEDWEYHLAEVGDKYLRPREAGLTQNHFMIQPWGVQRCFRMVEEAETAWRGGRRYDAVLRVRLDSFWFAPLPSLRPLLATGAVLVRAASNAEQPGGFSNVPSDQFAFVPRDHAEVYFVQWLENLANETFIRNVYKRVQERWNKYIGGEGSLRLAFEEHNVPYDRHPFPFAVFRSTGRCFNVGQPPGTMEGCRRVAASIGGAAFEAAVQRCVNHTCCSSYGFCEDQGSSPWSCRCRPLPPAADFDFGAWLLAGAAATAAAPALEAQSAPSAA